MAGPSESFSLIGLDQIEPDLEQPRSRVAHTGDLFGGMPNVDTLFRKDTEKKDVRDSERSPGPVESLTDSILAQGVLQPILVEPIGDGRYKIIAGERRWWAARAARDLIAEGKVDQGELKPGYDYQTIPARIIEMSGDQDRLAVQLVENIQRHDMPDEDIGRALIRMRTEAGEPLTQTQLARRLGVSLERIRDFLCAGTEEGRTTKARLGAGSWYDVRRFLAQQNDPRDKNRREICDAVYARLKAGESFSRSMLLQEIEYYEARKRAKNDAIRLAEIEKLQAEERKASEARREAEQARQKAEVERLRMIKRLREAEQKAVEKSEISAAIAEAARLNAQWEDAHWREMHADELREQDENLTTEELQALVRGDEDGGEDDDLPPPEIRGEMLKRRADRVQRESKPPPRLPGETDAAYLTRVDQSDEFAASYTRMMSSKKYADLVDAFSASDPEERLVTVSVDLPVHKAERLAGLLDAIIKSNNIPSHARLSVTTGYDVESRIKALVEKL